MEYDFLEALLDEVSLEGLDGITVNALWIRLKNRPTFGIAIDEKSKSFLWNCLAVQEEVELYELPELRQPLVLLNRFDYLDPETGQWIEPKTVSEIYPLCIINDEPVQGSCSTYHTRKNITDCIRSRDLRLSCSYLEAEKRWGEKLVVVASQKLRTRCLMGPDKLYVTLGDTTYCILERIGRARHGGELTRGGNSLTVFNKSANKIFYFRKILLQHGLITKQSFLMTSVQNRQLHARLLHLPRFYMLKKSRYMVLIEKLCGYLQEKHNQQEVFTTCREEIGLDVTSFKKLVRHASKYVRTYSVSYRNIYPESNEEEYMTKSKQKERTLKMIQLISSYGNQEDDDMESEDGEENKFEVTEQEEQPVVFKLVHERPLIYQAMKIIDSTGPSGVTQRNLERCMNITRLESRCLCRYVTRLNLVHTFLKDDGRQRKTVYISKKFINDSMLHQEFQKERNKMQQLLESSSENIVKMVSSQDGNKNTTSLESSELSASVTVNEVEIISSEEKPNTSGVKNSKKKNEIGKKEKLTSKILQRTNWILEAVKKARLVDKTFALKNMIMNNEKELGEKFTVDKKSVSRILVRLQKQGLIKQIKTLIKVDDQEKELVFICDSSLSPDDQLVKSAIEQAKLKYFGVSKEHVKSSSKCNEASQVSGDLPSSVQDSIKKLKEHRSKMKPSDMLYDPTCSKKYGVLPKFRKAELIHKLLFYLVYNYEGKEQTPSSPSQLCFETDDNIDIEVSCKLQSDGGHKGYTWKTFQKSNPPPVYLDEDSWKRHLAPLPQHEGFPQGWCLISDVLLLLPVHIFCQIVSLPYRISSLKEILEDPLKRHYPIPYLPFKIVQQLLFARRYIFTFYDVCTLLCHMGLLSFGNQLLKEKDQVFIYLHKKASVVDTRNSKLGYCKTDPPDSEIFPVSHYTFDSEKIVERYWLDIHFTALHTALGQIHKAAEENERTLEEPNSISLQQALSPKTPDAIVDIGIMPGDGYGACGLDSSLFSHIVRNWLWYSETSNLRTANKEKKTQLMSAKAMEDKSHMGPGLFQDNSAHQRLPRLFGSKTVKLTVKEGVEENVLVRVKKNASGNKGGKGIKRKMVDTVKPQVVKKRRVFKRFLKGGEKRSKKAEYYDEKDRLALKYKKKERVDWTSQEDSFLLICKVANLFLENTKQVVRRRMIVAWSKVRDMLHDKYYEYAKDKTSKACQRRVSFVMKNPQTTLNVSAFLQEALHDVDLIAEFGSKRFTYTQDEETSRVFEGLVNRLVEKFASMQYTKRFDLPCSLENFYKQYTVHPIGGHRVVHPHKDVATEQDICSSVLHNLIHCYLSLKDKQGRAFEMYKLFSQYPEELLISVFSQMRADGIITKVKREPKRRSLKAADFFAVNSHQLSQRYSYQFLSRYPQTMFLESYEMFTLLEKTLDQPIDIGLNISDLRKSGHPACIITLVALRLIDFHTVVPKQIIVLDSEGIKTTPIGRGKRPATKELLQSDAEEMETIGELEIVDESSKVNRKTENIPNVHECKGKESSPTENLEANNPFTNEMLRASENSECCVSEEMLEEPLIHESDSKLPEMCKVSQASRMNLSLARSQNLSRISWRELNPQDNFVINSCMVNATLKQSCGSCSMKAASRDGENSMSSILLISSKLKALLRGLVELVPFEIDVNGIWENVRKLGNISNRELLLTQQVYAFIARSSEMGARKHELQVHYQGRWPLVRKCLTTLESHQAILKVGVTVERYVALVHARPWLIHAYKNLKGRPSRLQSQSSDSLLTEKSKTKTLKQPENKTAMESVCEMNRDASCVNPRTDEPVHLDSNKIQADYQCERDKQKITNMLKRKYSEASSCPQPVSTYGKVRSLCRPWKKPEGSLNKPTFKMMLESLLLYIISHPGITEEALFNKYQTCLQPFVVMELLQILEDIGCVTKTLLKKPKPFSLFSKISPIKRVGEDQGDHIVVYDSTMENNIRMGHFISNLDIP